jgi:hypothetical protein
MAKCPDGTDTGISTDIRESEYNKFVSTRITGVIGLKLGPTLFFVTGA